MPESLVSETVDVRSGITLHGVMKTYLGVHAVRDVDLEVRPGECLGLIGKNGAGKSTLIKILAGVVSADAGTVIIDGEKVSVGSPRDARRLGFAFLHQDLNDVPTLSVEANLWMGYPLPRTGWGKIDNAAARRRAVELLELVGATASPGDRMGDLSIAQRQLVMLARAVSHEARLVVMDEPTATLSAREVDHLREVLDTLRRRGTSVIFVSHRLAEVREFCDRVVVMRDGAVVAADVPASVSESELVALITGEDTAGAVADAARLQPRARGEVVLEVDGLTRSPLVHDISFTLHAGEVLGIAGLVGSGRTELTRALVGVDPAEGGSVTVPGHGRVVLDSPRAAMAAGISLIPEDRLRNGLVKGFSIRENLTLPTLRRHRRFSWLPMPVRRREEAVSDDIIDRLRIACSGPEQHVSFLSGGNQQKVVLGKALLQDADVLIFDEPTDGVDVGAREEIYAEIDRLADQGKGVILISAEFSELVQVCDRVLVMREGAVVGELDQLPLTEASMLSLCYTEGGTAA